MADELFNAGVGNHSMNLIIGHDRMPSWSWLRVLSSREHESLALAPGDGNNRTAGL